MPPDAIDDAVSWYIKNRKRYEDLASEVHQTIVRILESKGVRAYDITHRAKDVESFRKKLENGVHFDPKDMQDLAGVRIIGLLNTDVQRISDIIRNAFEIDENRTKDRTKQASLNMVGYRSIHFVAKFDRDRAKLPDYARFKDMYFEIQVRTILQHAWAEIQHDNNYKFPGTLRADLQRRFYLLAGMLEVVDNEFENIVNEVEIFQKTSSKRRADLDVPIDLTSLNQYMVEKFGAIYGVVPKIGYQTDSAPEVIRKLNIMSITTLEQLDRIVPPNLKEAYSKHTSRIKVFPLKYTYATILNHIMISKDAELYSAITNRGKRVPMHRLSFDILTFAGLNPSILEKYWIITNDPV